MTENEGGTPRDPQRDPETPATEPTEPPTEPAADSLLGAERPPSAPGAPAPDAPYGQPEASTPYEQQGAPAAYGQSGAPAAPQYGYAQSPPKNDLAVWSLVTGILSYVTCPLLLGIAAIVTGTMGRRAADEGLANNRGMATAGLILGWVNVALAVIGIILFFVLLAAGLFAGGMGSFNEMRDMNDMNGY